MWPLIGSHTARLPSVVNTATSLGIQVTAGASNAKGAWTQLIASAPYEVSWLGVYLDGINVASTYFLVDIGLGAAGAEQVLIPNLFAGNYAAFSPIWLPVQIPAGTRIAARAQTNNTSTQNIYVALLLGRGRWSWDNAGQDVVAYGAVTASTDGTTVQAGSPANTQGPWTQIAAATTRAHESLLIASRVVNIGIIQLGIGPSGSEQSIMDEFVVARASCGAAHVFYVWLPVGVPEGSRLVARFRSSTNNGTTRVIVYGL